jgi:hypothetical protein
MTRMRWRRSFGTGAGDLTRADGKRATLRMLGGLIADPSSAAERLADVDEPYAASCIRLAREHGVDGWLAAYAPGTPAWAIIADQRLRLIGARARDRAELACFAEIASHINCRWVVLKGQALADDLYPKPWIRHGVDIDVLVEPARFTDLVDVLLDHGWRLHDVNWPLLDATRPGQLRLGSPRGGLFDVHWNLMDNPELRTSFPFKTEELLDRGRILVSGLPALGEADQLVHVGLHAAMSGATRLLWLVDVGLAARRVIDSPELATAACSARAGLALALVLQRAHRWLGTPAPAPALRSLGATMPWRAVCRSVDRLSPLAEQPDRPALGHALARSTRGGLGSTALEFGRHLAGFVRSGAPHTRTSSPLRDPTDPRSPLFPLADPAARARYFDAVSMG